MSPVRRRAAAFAALILSASATATAGANARRIGFEVDPLPFFHHGYSVHLVTKPDRAAAFRLGFGAFGYDLPTPTGDNDGFSARVDALEMNAGYFPFSEGVLRGAFVGLYGFEQRFRYRRDGVTGEARRHQIVLAPAVGYQLMLWQTGPYLTPWAALGAPIAKSGGNTVAGRSYTEAKVVPVLALHLGWELRVL